MNRSGSVLVLLALVALLPCAAFAQEQPAEAPPEAAAAPASDPAATPDPAAPAEPASPGAESAAPAAAPEPPMPEILNVGRIPFLDPRKMVQDHEPLMKYLKEKLGLKECRLVLAPNYEELTEFLRQGKIDVAWHGTLAYPEARRKEAGTVVLRPKRYGADSYGGIVIARVDSGIEAIADLKGKSFAYTDRESASGFYYPRLMMMKSGIDPDRDLSKTQELRKHDNILYAVLYKRFDAGAVYDDAREHMKTDKEREQLKIVARTERIPNEPLMARKGLHARLRDRFVEAMLALGSGGPDEAAIMKATGNVEGFVKATDDDYAVLFKDMESYDALSAKFRAAGTAEVEAGKSENPE